LIICIFKGWKLIEDTVLLILFAYRVSIWKPLSSDDLVICVIHRVEQVFGAFFVVVFILSIEKDDFHANYVYLKWTCFVLFLINHFLIFLTLGLVFDALHALLQINWPRNFILYDSAENSILAHLSPLNVLANLFFLFTRIYIFRYIER